MSTLRDYVRKLQQLMNFMVLDIPDEINKEELLVTIETDNVDALRRVLEEDSDRKLWPIEASPPAPIDVLGGLCGHDRDTLSGGGVEICNTEDVGKLGDQEEGGMGVKVGDQIGGSKEEEAKCDRSSDLADVSNRAVLGEGGGVKIRLEGGCNSVRGKEHATVQIKVEEASETGQYSSGGEGLYTEGTGEGGGGETGERSSSSSSSGESEKKDSGHSSSERAGGGLGSKESSQGSAEGVGQSSQGIDASGLGSDDDGGGEGGRGGGEGGSGGKGKGKGGSGGGSLQEPKAVGSNANPPGTNDDDKEEEAQEDESDLEDRRRMFRVWASTSSDTEEDEKHLQFVTGSTLLHIAAKCGAIKCIDELLKTPDFHPNMYIADYGGALPLHWAVSANKPTVVDRLVKAGSRVNVGDILGRTALHIACSKGFIGCVKALLQAGSELDLNARDPDGFTALISTMLRRKHYYNREVNGKKPNTARHVEIMQLLIDAGADLDYTAKSGFSALHLSVHLADIEPFIDCLLHSDVDIDRRIVTPGYAPEGCFSDMNGDIYGPTPLWFAIAGNHLVAARKLILANANLNVCCRKQSVSSMGQLNCFPKRDVFAEMVQQFTSRDFLGVRPLDSAALSVDTTFEKVMTPYGIAVTRDLFQFAFDVVQCGFMVSRHDVEWFQSRLERLAMTELPEHLAKARAGRSMLCELGAVRSLQWWCRRGIRLGLPSGFSRLGKAVDSLDLPYKIKDYLLLKDVFEEPLVAPVQH